MDNEFDDLLEANRAYADQFDLSLEGAAAAGLGIVTCMDSRIDPLAMLGLQVGDAKVVRNPGGRVTDQALTAMVLATQLLRVDRVLVVQHTRCAVASNDEQQLRTMVEEASGKDATWQEFPVVDDQLATLQRDVQRVATHPLVPDTVKVAGFVYDVDSGRLARHA